MAEPGCDENGVCVDPKTYFFHIIGKREGEPANDHEMVVKRAMLDKGAQQNVPEGELPGRDWPFKAIAVMVSGGVARGRLFLPSNVAQIGDNGNRWYTKDVQYIADGPGGLVWKWTEMGGVYVPIQVIYGEETGGGDGGTDTGNGDGGDQNQELQTQIDELKRQLDELKKSSVQYGGTFALRIDSGVILCVSNGGPGTANQPVKFESRHAIGAWETFTVEKP